MYLDYSRYMGGSLFLLMITFIMSMLQSNNGESDLWLEFWPLSENQEECQNNRKSNLILFDVYWVNDLSSML